MGSLREGRSNGQGTGLIVFKEPLRESTRESRDYWVIFILDVLGLKAEGSEGYGVGDILYFRSP